jgi:amyloid beta (A4) precursor protein-binding family B protein 2 (Fe65-like)
MEEPKKVLRAQYLGSTQVSRATGMDILNDAVDRLVSTLPTDKWRSVNVAVAPSMISILNPSVCMIQELTNCTAAIYQI